MHSIKYFCQDKAKLEHQWHKHISGVNWLPFWKWSIIIARTQQLKPEHYDEHTECIEIKWKTLKPTWAHLDILMIFLSMTSGEQFMNVSSTVGPVKGSDEFDTTIHWTQVI